jgi:ethanolaminephosphotransferase
LTTTFPGSKFGSDSIKSCEFGTSTGIEGAQCSWALAQQLLSDGAEDEDSYHTAGPALSQFSKIAQEVMSRTASNYDISRLSLGLLITALAGLLVLPATVKECTQRKSSGLFLTLMIITYGLMMFASSYVEEEQQFWYWICSGWIFYLHIKSESAKPEYKRSGSFPWSGRCAIIVLAISQRFLRRWNQTGQKFAAEPDIAHTFFGRHPEIFWGLLILTYLDAGFGLVRKMPISGFLKFGALVPAALALTFKLHFVASESPELLDGTLISQVLKEWPYSISLVLHARLVFYALGAIVLLTLLVKKNLNVAKGMLSLILYHLYDRRQD